MKEPRKIQTALISVYHKDGILPLAEKLQGLGISIISTGGTFNYLKENGIKCTTVESVTTFPSILGGRVKTLHPAILGGILFRRENSGDVQECNQHAIDPIDLVVVDLYPFSETVRSGAGHEEITEQTDIGGISLIRAAAKNHKDVLVIPDRRHYTLLNEILEQGAVSDYETRFRMAGEAFAVSAAYDTAIASYYGRSQDSDFLFTSGPAHSLRYGENPHQKAWFYGNPEMSFDILGGKDLSYNNLCDAETGWALTSSFNKPFFTIIKHQNPCGAAIGNTPEEAWEKALAGDPQSAFGGVICTNCIIDARLASEISSMFFEVLAAPAFEEDALNLLKTKKNRILLRMKPETLPELQFKSVWNGVLCQERDIRKETKEDFRYVTSSQPEESQTEDLLFAATMAAHMKSNAIALVKNGMLTGSGMGQTSRIDALKQAMDKANTHGHGTVGAVMASDAFFPFPDCVEIAAAGGIRNIIQPGGSIRDNDSIAACDKLGVAMVFTGIRHFKH